MFGRAGKLNKAFEAVRQLPKRYGFSINAHVYTCLMSACIANKEVNNMIYPFYDLSNFMIYPNLWFILFHDPPPFMICRFTTEHILGFHQYIPLPISFPFAPVSFSFPKLSKFSSACKATRSLLTPRPTRQSSSAQPVGAILLRRWKSCGVHSIWIIWTTEGADGS